MLNIRPLRDGDETEWLRLRRDLWPGAAVDALELEVAAIRADQSRQPVFVVERPGGGLCGLVEVSIHSWAPGCASDRIGYLEAWYVDPDWRRRGLGRRLVETAEAWARSAGCREMASDTTPDYPLSPQAHAGLGYREVQQFRKDLP